MISKYSQEINKYVLNQVLKGEKMLSCELDGRVWYVSTYWAYSVPKDEAFISGLPLYKPESLSKMILESDYNPEYLTDTQTEKKVGSKATDVVKVFKNPDGEDIFIKKNFIKPLFGCDFIGKYKAPWQASIAVVCLGQIVGIVMPVNRSRGGSV